MIQSMHATRMRALVKSKSDRGIWMEEVATPAPGTNEVLIQVEKTAICGTDVHIFNWDDWARRTIKPGLIIGHEFVGKIAALGEGDGDGRHGEPQNGAERRRLRGGRSGERGGHAGRRVAWPRGSAKGRASGMRSGGGDGGGRTEIAPAKRRGISARERVTGMQPILQ